MNSSQATDCVYLEAGTIEGAIDCSYWRPYSNDANPWLQVGLIDPVFFYQIYVYCIEYSHSASTFRISHSLNGMDWTDWNLGNEISSTIYCPGGNSAYFSTPILGRAVRIYPTSWTDYFEMKVSLRFYDLSDDEFSYLNTGEEIAALLTGARFFASNAYSANSLYGYYITKTTGATTGTDYNENGFWVVGQNNFIQIGIHNPKEWVRIETKGSQDIMSYVTTYQLKYSYNGVNFYDYNSGEIINANSDNTNLVAYGLNPTVIARSLRIYPLTWIPDSTTSPFAIRVEAYYINTQITSTNEEMGAVCSAGYLYSGGVEKEIYRDNHFLGFVPNSQNAYSSAWIQYLQPADGTYYIQLGMVYPKLWTKIQTKGREPDTDCSDCEMYVSKYSIQYSDNGASWDSLYDDFIFEGNENTSEIKENIFVQKFESRVIRVVIKECASAGCALQLEAFYEDNTILPDEYSEYYDSEKQALLSGGYFLRSSFAEIFQFGYKINLINNYFFITGTEAEPWVLISMGTIVKFTGFSTRLLNSISDGTFTVKYSLDGITWNEVDSGAIFQGSINKDIPKRNSFATPVVGRTLKIYPQNSVTGYFSFQVDAYYEEMSKNEIYTNYFGGQIDAFQAGAGIITSSYYYETDLSIKYRMGYLIDYPDNPVQGFRFEDNDLNKYFQFGVPDLKKWTKIEIQGAEGQSCWIITLTIKYSIDGDNWSFLLNEIEANSDETTIITINFDSPVLARALRLIPIEWNSCAAFRIRPYYSEPSLEDLLLQNTDTEMHAVQVGTPVEMSSYYSEAYAVGYPLNQDHGIAQCWRPLSDIQGQWIQFSTTSKKIWTAFRIQGRHANDEFCKDTCEEYVTFYKIEFSLDGNTFKEYNFGYSISTLIADSNVDAIKTHFFGPQLKATSIRIFPLGFQTHISMRIDAIFKEDCDWKCDGCKISNDDTKCTSCKSFYGIEGTLNDDGETYTCQCSSFAAENSQNESCGEVHETIFDFSSENPTYNLGNTGTFSLCND